MKIKYYISSRDYLERAKECLKNNNPKFLFYATFEIRCGVEARMLEYLEVQKHIVKKKRQGWRIANIGKNIEKAFKLGDKVAILKIYDSAKKNIIFETKYTPVKSTLKKRAEKLGNYLHSAKKFYDSDNKYWSDLRRELENAIKELEEANSGRLLGPLLLHPDKKMMDMKLEILNDEEREKAKVISKIGAKIIADVSYK